MIHNLEMYILLFFTYAFAGWFMESVLGIFNVKKFVNRGFLIGPYCPVYGVGVVLITILLKKYITDIPLLFVMSILICGILEYFTGYVMEKLFNARWWDYRNNRFNINGRVCLETLLPFGIAATIIISKLNPLLINLYNKIPEMILHIITLIMSVLFIIDFIISFKIILSFKGEIRKQKDNTEEISEKVREKTEELSEFVKDKAEDVWMQTESDIRYYGRKYKLKFLRKSRYTRNRISETMSESLEKLAMELNEKRIQIEERLKDEKQKIDEQLKAKKEEFEVKQKDRIDHTKQVVEKFKEKSILKNRLMEAFPKLEIKDKHKK